MYKPQPSVVKHKCASISFSFAVSDRVLFKDYYSLFLVRKLISYAPKINLTRHTTRILDIGTGCGYISILLAKIFPLLRAVSTDLNPEAVCLARENIKLNALEHKIEVREHGDLFTPLKAREAFDLIVSAPPQIPITQEDLVELKIPVPCYHSMASVGGPTGRDVLDRLIEQAPRYMKQGSYLVLTHADFVNPQRTLVQFKVAGLEGQVWGYKKKLLSETTLTRALKKKIEDNGYSFKRDACYNEFFKIVVLAGRKL